MQGGHGVGFSKRLQCRESDEAAGWAKSMCTGASPVMGFGGDEWKKGGKQEGATRLLTGYRTGDGGEGAGSGSSGARGVNWKVRTWCWRGRGMASGSWGSAATEDDKGKV